MLLHFIEYRLDQLNIKHTKAAVNLAIQLLKATPKEISGKSLKFFDSPTTKWQPCNLGQKIGDKFTKLSKVGFSMEWVIADFLQLFTKMSQILSFAWTAGYSPSNPRVSGTFLKFPNSLRSLILSRSATPEATRTVTFW